MSSLLNRAQCKKLMLDEARCQGKTRLVRVSAETLDWLERELVKKMKSVVSMSPHGGPKTIYPPERMK